MYKKKEKSAGRAPEGPTGLEPGLRHPPSFTGSPIGPLPVSSLLEVLHAAHHSWLVESPWEERGGILLVAPPGQLKTTMIYTLNDYPQALCTSDINIRSMKSVRDMVLSGNYKTLAFGEMEKLYARNPATAQNIESHLKQFAEEGLRHFSHEDSAVPIMPARALIIAGMTPGMFARQYTAWNESGFLRRFLRIQYTLQDEKAILEAVHQWKKVSISLPIEWNGKLFNIPYNLDNTESKMVMELMRDQPHSTPSVLLKRIAVVLKIRNPKGWKKTLKDLAPSLGRNGALLRL